MHPLVRSFALSQRLRGLSNRTIENRIWWLQRLPALHGNRSISDVTSREITDYLGKLVEEGKKPWTVLTAFQCFHAFFSWCVQEGELVVSPLAGVPKPKLTDTPVKPFVGAEVAALLRVCAGTGFVARRDTAVISLLAATPIRLGGLTKLRTKDVEHLDSLRLTVTEKYGRTRVMPFGEETALALDRYLRVREEHPLADDPALWLGRRGPMTGSGLRQLVHNRGEQAGVEGAHPHRFRHTFAHSWLLSGGQEGDLMQLAGWRTRRMVDRYSASAAQERAIHAYRELYTGTC